jgi:hypothetical protein
VTNRYTMRMCPPPRAAAPGGSSGPPHPAGAATPDFISPPPAGAVVVKACRVMRAAAAAHRGKSLRSARLITPRYQPGCRRHMACKKDRSPCADGPTLSALDITNIMSTCPGVQRP